MELSSLPAEMLLCWLDKQGRIQAVNDAWQCQLSLTAEQLLGRPLFDPMPHDSPIDYPMPEGPCCLPSYPLCDGHGQLHQLQWLLEPTADGWIGAAWDVTQLSLRRQELEHALEQARQQMVTDPLTGLKNRRAFDERLDEELARHIRFKRPLSMLMIDVDDFKPYNDSFGHQDGDQVLKKLGQCLQQSIRAIDFVARVGGEEFAVLFPNTTIEESLLLGERLRHAVEKETWWHRPITISLGGATISHQECRHPEASLRLYKKADEGLYLAKKNGRNQLRHVGMVECAA